MKKISILFPAVAVALAMACSCNTIIEEPAGPENGTELRDDLVEIRISATYDASQSSTSADDATGDNADAATHADESNSSATVIPAAESNSSTTATHADESNSSTTATHADESNSSTTATPADESNSSASPATKTTLSGHDVLWAGGDAISLINLSGAEYNAELTLCTEPGYTSGDFSGEAVPSEDGWFGVYPYNPEYHLGDDMSLNLKWYGNNQLPVDNGFDAGKALMVGLCKEYGEEGPKIQFRNLFSYFKFTLDFPCEEVTISGNLSGDILGCATLNVTMDFNGIPKVTGTGLNKPGDVDVTLRPGQGSTAIEPGTYCLAVLPGTLKAGFTFSCKHARTGLTYKKVSARELEMKRNTILNLGELDETSFSTTGDFEGAGTATNPYRISSKEQVEKLANLVNNEKTHDAWAGKHYVQTCDIDCEGQTMTTIGMYDYVLFGSNTAKAFTGYYNGNGYKISNYKCGQQFECAGFFGGVVDAKISSLTLEPSGLNNSWGDQTRYGGFIGYSYSTEDGFTILTDCHYTSSGKEFTITATDKYTCFGGLIGECDGNLRLVGCTSDANLTATITKAAEASNPTGVGGMIGMCRSDEFDTEVWIDRCVNSGKIFAYSNASAYAGGIIGKVWESDGDDVDYHITNCTNTGDIMALSNDYVPGIFGKGNASAGGIIGSNDADGNTSWDEYIANCLNTGAICGIGEPGYGGGLIGYTYDDDTHIYACASTGSVSKTNKDVDPSATSYYTLYAGGLGAEDGDWHYCYWTPDLPIVDAEGDSANTEECSRKTDITASLMNSAKTHIPSAKFPDISWCSWAGSSASGDLHLVY